MDQRVLNSIEDAPAKISSRPQKHHLPALDGIRFLAAFCVLAGHSYWYIVLLQDGAYQPTPIDNLVLSLPSLGMTLFFVLSGYVIHLNYSETVGPRRSGNLDFFIARFARLYPLFLVVFAYDFTILLWSSGYLTGHLLRPRDLFSALPLYVTFTETWWLWPIGPVSAYQIYGSPLVGATGVMWSLSTEAFFYAVFPFLAIWLGRLSGKSLATALLAVTFLGLVYYLGSLALQGAITSLGARWFPQVPDDQLFHWIIFLSPWGRIFEFLLGALGAQLFLIRNDRPSSRSPIATYAVLLLLGVFTVVVGLYGDRLRSVSASLSAFVVSAFVYFAIRERSMVSRVLSSWPLVVVGSASYSLYLLHYFIAHDQGREFAIKYPSVPRLIVWLGAMGLSIAVALVVYRIFERPSTRWVRKNFRRLQLQYVLPAVMVTLGAMSVVASLQAGALERVTAIPTAGRIQVTGASFGENCNPHNANNELQLTRLACDGRSDCSFVYDVNLLGDPAGGCVKSYTVDYRCGPGSSPNRYAIEKFSTNVETISFSCPNPAAG